MVTSVNMELGQDEKQLQGFVDAAEKSVTQVIDDLALQGSGATAVDLLKGAQISANSGNMTGVATSMQSNRAQQRTEIIGLLRKMS